MVFDTHVWRNLPLDPCLQLKILAAFQLVPVAFLSVFLASVSSKNVESSPFSQQISATCHLPAHQEYIGTVDMVVKMTI